MAWASPDLAEPSVISPSRYTRAFPLLPSWPSVIETISSDTRCGCSRVNPDVGPASMAAASDALTDLGQVALESAVVDAAPCVCAASSCAATSLNWSGRRCPYLSIVMLMLAWPR
jgi:hypothetical protein